MSTTLLILGCLCAQSSSSPAIPPDQFLALVHREAVPKWSLYMDMIQECEINYRSDYRHFRANGEVISDHPATKVIEGAYILLKDYGSRREVLIGKKLSGETHTAECFNTRYSFELRGSAADKLALKEVTSPITPTDIVTRALRAGVVAKCTGWIVFGKHLHDLWSDATIALDPVRQNGRGNYLVPFVQRKDGKVIYRCEIELNPNQGWRIEASRSGVLDRLERTEEMSYGNDGFPVPIPNRYVFNETDVKTGHRLQAITAVSRFQSHPRRAEEEFTLSAYGLPEPVGVVWKKPTPRYVWFLVAAGMFGVLAVGFRRLARGRVPKVSA
jgi:hypothetical protein